VNNAGKTINDKRTAKWKFWRDGSILPKYVEKNTNTVISTSLFVIMNNCESFFAKNMGTEIAAMPMII